MATTNHELLYYIPAGQYGKEGVLALLEQHPEIKFVSLVGIDLAGNDTDEKIPMSAFFDDYESFFEGRAVQTDGSSVVLTNIATLNNARVDMWGDPSVNWFVDYNYENIDPATGLPTGTLRIPAFLMHNYRYVDSRSILKRSCDYVKTELLNLIKEHGLPGMPHVKSDDVVDIIFTSATELEFWVKTPARTVTKKELSVSQKLQEQYWQRTHGTVRTALEQAVERLDKYGMVAEMGHKEVGGVKAKLDEFGHEAVVLEQLEIDWKFCNNPLQTADNELQARIIVREVFRENGLDVTFNAKPIIGVAGSGEHTHFGVMAKLKSGKLVNLFSPEDMRKEACSSLGIGAIMGLLKHYEAINPFISSTTDALNRLKPGFEAPVCIVTSFGTDPSEPNRNRTILCGLIRDIDNPMATRFELRSPNPYTNTYTALALIFVSAFDGMKYAITCGKTQAQLLAEISKEVGESADYLDTNRAYRTEKDVFDDFTQEERNQMFGVAPATVWENVKGYYNNPELVETLSQGDAFAKDLMESFIASILKRWELVLANRLIPNNLDAVRNMVAIHTDSRNSVDDKRFAEVNDLRFYLAKDSDDRKSLFTRLTEALNAGEYDLASKLQIEMNDKMEELEAKYANYAKNIF
ncbi:MULTISPECIES: glutamine synthetase [unclassified Veillonella]|uniref:glutamine synthetase n=1 Tax=unclassified Veillonella TaxID=2630086 RepID=UPI0001EB43A0|nr:MULTISPECIES: glutamine synthetase [unclassified Veillonella]EFR60487.1 glutamate--ammonia ligase, catalytic domain protein [Veillonella sp. oral taxon 158 str. F0412]MDU6206555.1 glutamine synthetase [Veillonella sp.]